MLLQDHSYCSLEDWLEGVRRRQSDQGNDCRPKKKKKKGRALEREVLVDRFKRDEIRLCRICV